MRIKRNVKNSQKNIKHNLLKIEHLKVNNFINKEAEQLPVRLKAKI